MLDTELTLIGKTATSKDSVVRFDPMRHIIQQGNSESLPLRDSCVDIVLTSPPYCTRIDYAVATAVELAVMGIGKRTGYDNLRQQLMGTTTVPKIGAKPQAAWGPTCVKFLRQMKHHESKASQTYYYKNHVQYFSSLHKSIREIARVLKKEGIAVVVAQDSHYKDLFNDVPKIISEMANGAGLRGFQLERFPVSTSYAQMNARSKKYVADRRVAESVLCFYKR